ncbi:efflux RND transporter periplasmic adaptor subunit [Aliikangiella sp. IMCC44632]
MSLAKSILLGCGIFILAIVGFVIMLANKPSPPKKPEKPTAPLVQVYTPQPETVDFTVEAHGVVTPRTSTMIISEVSGVVQTVADKFVAGGYFEAGEVMLQIDPTDYQVSYEQAKAKLAGQQAKYQQEVALAEQAKKEWDLTGRARNNAPVLALREPFLKEAKANVDSALADLKRAEQKLARTTIIAPYTGMIKSKHVDVGQYVSVGSQLAETFAIDYAEIRLPLTDQELAFINVPNWNDIDSKEVQVALQAQYQGKLNTWHASLVRMEGVVDEQSRVHYAVAKINDPYGVLSSANKSNKLPPLKIGTFVTAVIAGKTQAGLISVPREAFRNLNTVLVVDKDNKLHLRTVNVVRTESSVTYIDEGLKEFDRIVMTPLESPVEGSSVRVDGDATPPTVTKETDIVAQD